MVRQPRESEPAVFETESVGAAVDAVEGGAATRRNFLQLGAVAAVGLASGCAGGTPGDDDTMGGSSGTGTGGSSVPGGGKGGTTMMGSGGTSGSAGSATMNGGTGNTAQGGTGTGGTAQGGTGTGGTSGTAQGGSGAGGAANPAGGAGNVGGAPEGGMGGVATGGMPPNGGMPNGGMPSAGSGGSTGMTGKGGKENNYEPLPALPPGTSANIPKLPDPFKFIDGTRISKKEDWEKLRADLSAMVQAAVYGPKMPPPDKLEASISGTTVTVNMTVGSKTAMFTFTVTGGSTSSPKPAVIRCGNSGVPFPSSVVSINLAQDSFAAQNKMIPTTGIVSTLYGNTAAKAGSDICWAWGASRIIDALEKVDAGIDPTKIATSGCSYAGKGALAMGAFDERVVLTAMQEGGSGGSALWRVSTKEASLGQNIQEATEIVGEQNWEGGDFKALFSGKDKKTAPVEKLLADQHFVVAICAPRAVILIENDIDWLGPLAAYGGGVAAREVFTALGIADRIGISVAPNHGHCSFPSSQQADLTKFINRFMLGMPGDTSGVDLLNATNSKIKTWNKADWIDWDTPTLSGSLTWDPFA